MQNLSQISDSLDLQVVDRIDGRDVTRGELSAAFDRVADPRNWKNPIDAEISVDDARELELVVHAVEFFAGCKASTTPTRPGFVRVKAPGYYLAVGA